MNPLFHDDAAFRPARRKVFVRLMPWLLVLYVIACMDCVVTLEMSANLGFADSRAIRH